MNLWWIYPGMVAASLIGAGIAQLHNRRQQRREARVQQQRDQRMAEVNARLRRGRHTSRPITLADIQALDQQLTDLDRYANRIQPLYLAEEGK